MTESLMLALILVRLFFIPDSALPGATPYLDVGQGALLPHGALAIMLTVLSFNLLGDGLRDAMDPRLAQVAKS